VELPLTLSSIGLCIFAYLVGSVSTAILVCRVFAYPDPRSEGSNNPGTTNVLRIAGKVPALLTLAGDVAKGVIPVLIGRWLLKDDYILAMMGFCAFLGHLFPVFFNFEGGKGVATALGVITTLAWPVGLAVMLIWLIVALLSRISSLSALISWALAPLIVHLYMEQIFYPIAAMSVFLIFRHHENIKKLITGTESRIGAKSSQESTP